MLKKEFWTCWKEEWVLMSHQPSLLCRVVSRARVVNLAILSKSHNFSALSSFRILEIILPTDIQIGWFKLVWKDNSEYYNFHEETFLRKSRLDGWKYPWTYCICLNGDPWDCMVPFRVLEYKLGIFQHFQGREHLKNIWRNIN